MQDIEPPWFYRCRCLLLAVNSRCYAEPEKLCGQWRAGTDGNLRKETAKSQPIYDAVDDDVNLVAYGFHSNTSSV